MLRARLVQAIERWQVNQAGARSVTCRFARDEPTGNGAPSITKRPRVMVFAGTSVHNVLRLPFDADKDRRTRVEVQRPIPRPGQPRQPANSSRLDRGQPPLPRSQRPQATNLLSGSISVGHRMVAPMLSITSLPCSSKRRPATAAVSGHRREQPHLCSAICRRRVATWSADTTAVDMRDSYV
jgi:hypothetical protein